MVSSSLYYQSLLCYFDRILQTIIVNLAFYVWFLISFKSFALLIFVQVDDYPLCYYYSSLTNIISVWFYSVPFTFLTFRSCQQTLTICYKTISYSHNYSLYSEVILLCFLTYSLQTLSHVALCHAFCYYLVEVNAHFSHGLYISENPSYSFLYRKYFPFFNYYCF